MGFLDHLIVRVMQQEIVERLHDRCRCNRAFAIAIHSTTVRKFALRLAYFFGISLIRLVERVYVCRNCEWPVDFGVFGREVRFVEVVYVCHEGTVAS